jgi:hypothetical protein
VILGVAAVGALGVGVTYHVLHEVHAQSYKDDCQNDKKLPAPNCKSRYDSVHMDGYIFVGGYALGAVLAGVATYLLVRTPSAPTEKAAEPAATEAAATGFRFQCGPTAGLGVTCAGVF